MAQVTTLTDVIAGPDDSGQSRTILEHEYIEECRKSGSSCEMPHRNAA